MKAESKSEQLVTRTSPASFDSIRPVVKSDFVNESCRLKS